MAKVMDGVGAGAPDRGSRGLDRAGIFMVAGSALTWSFGGAIARSIGIDDTWTVVFWRSIFACVFLLSFMLWRDGPRGTIDLFRRMGWQGIAVGCCFASASISFVMAITFTTVANVILVGAGVPLLAALIGWIVFRTPVSAATWGAIAAVFGGVAVMVFDGGGGDGASLIGNALAMVMAVAFAVATVITRQYAGVRMTPAVTMGVAMAAIIAAANAGGFAVGAFDMVLLFAFGALNLGLGMAFFVTGARLIPAALTALIGTAETVLSPMWVWLLHDETPATRTLIGGAIVVTALIVHIAVEAARSQRVEAPAAST
jgi:drug/metabolite transporter (DMT)-like permease